LGHHDKNDLLRRFYLPLYSFHCKKCDKTFEVFLRPSETCQEMTCPDCRENDVEMISDKEQSDLTTGICGVKKDT
jgi:putative FmdB family regulatory protein